MLSHDAPSEANRALYKEFADPDEYNDWLQTIADRLTFKRWFFGHHHYDLFPIKDKYVLLYNLVVDLDLNIRPKSQKRYRKLSEI